MERHEHMGGSKANCSYCYYHPEGSGSERSKERSTNEAKRSEYVPDSGLWTAEEREAALQEAISLQDSGEIWQSVNPVEVERATDTVSALIRALEDTLTGHAMNGVSLLSDDNARALLAALKGEK